MKNPAVIFSVLILMLVQAAGGFCSDGKDEFEAAAGLKGYYSSGISEKNIYYKGFGRLSYLSSFFEVSAEGAWFQHFQVTDGLGDYQYINFSRGGGDVILFLPAGIDLGGAFYYSRGESGYANIEYNANARIEFYAFTLSGNFILKNERYDYNPFMIRSQKYDYSAEAGFSPEKFTIITAGYAYSTLSFNNLDYDYYIKTGRLGMTVKLPGSLMFSAGGVYGADSSDYTLYGGFLGANIRLFRMVKITLMYDLEYYSPPSLAVSSSAKQRKGNLSMGNGSGNGMINPYLQTGEIGKAYFSNKFVLGLSIIF